MVSDTDDADRIVAEMETDGFALGPRILDDHDADSLAAVVRGMMHDADDPNYEDVGRGDEQPFWFIDNVWQRDSRFAELTGHPLLVALLGRIMGVSRVRLFEDRIFYKLPDRTIARAWHRDTTYLPLRRPYKCVGAWIALSPVTEIDGPMVMLPGSFAQLHLPDEFSTDMSREAVVSAGYSTDPVVCPVPKGFVHFHNPDVLHGSSVNGGEHPRIGLSVFYVQEDVLFDSSGPYASFFQGTDGLPLSSERHPVFEVNT